MRGARPEVSHLLTPIYLGAVTALALNDHVLKQALPGVITGKLSDFAGLFAFAVFLSVAIRRHIPVIHALIAAAFVAWKSPLSDPLIEAWNATTPFRIARVVDYSDLVGLSVLPLSVAYLRRRWWTIAPGAARAVAVATMSLLVFAATSKMPMGEVEISMGNELVQAGQYEEAIKRYSQAIEVWPHSGEALYLRGIAKLKLGDTAGGEADIAAAAAINPKYKPPATGGTSRAN
jgi:tetratricopeptide (TPR) repeat protein